MPTLEGYRSTHSELRGMIDDLRSILTMEQLRIRPNAQTAYELLCDLGERVRRHLADEDRSLYPTLLIHDDPDVKSIAWGFLSGERPLRQSFDDYHSRWLKHCDHNFSNEFLAETHEVFAMVAQRIDREEAVLIPKLIEIGLFRQARLSANGGNRRSDAHGA
jgi:hypothetical protein